MDMLDCPYCRRPPGDTPDCAGCGAPQPYWIPPALAAQWEAESIEWDDEPEEEELIPLRPPGTYIEWPDGPARETWLRMYGWRHR